MNEMWSWACGESGRRATRRRAVIDDDRPRRSVRWINGVCPRVEDSLASRLIAVTGVAAGSVVRHGGTRTTKDSSHGVTLSNTLRP